MSKKSYKRNQNRLYREIKRRIELENMHIPQSKIVKCERDVDTIAVEGMFQNDIAARHAEMIKTEMARKISVQLLADGYIEFYSENTYEMTPINSVTRIRARLNVVKPWN